MELIIYLIMTATAFKFFFGILTVAGLLSTVFTAVFLEGISKWRKPEDEVFIKRTATRLKLFAASTIFTLFLVFAIPTGEIVFNMNADEIGEYILKNKHSDNPGSEYLSEWLIKYRLSMKRTSPQ